MLSSATVSAKHFRKEWRKMSKKLKEILLLVLLTVFLAILLLGVLTVFLGMLFSFPGLVRSEDSFTHSYGDGWTSDIDCSVVQISSILHAVEDRPWSECILAVASTTVGKSSEYLALVF